MVQATDRVQEHSYQIYLDAHGKEDEKPFHYHRGNTFTDLVNIHLTRQGR
jgi:hypothetical protein